MTHVPTIEIMNVYSMFESSRRATVIIIATDGTMWRHNTAHQYKASRVKELCQALITAMKGFKKISSEHWHEIAPLNLDKLES